MKRWIVAALAVLAPLAGASQASAASCTITAAGSGAWSSAATWSPARLPAATDDVCIPAGSEVTSNGAVGVASLQAAGTLKLTGGTFTLAGASSAARLDMSGGTLTGAGDLSVAAGTWSGGSMAGTGATRLTGTFTHSANTDLGRVLEVAGTLDLSVAGRYVNKSGTGAIRVTGLLKGAGTLYPPVDVSGRVEGVELYGGGSGGGEFAGTTFKQGTFALDGAKLTGVTIAGATLTGSATASGTMTSGVIGGAGTFAINGPFTWSGGAMSGTGTTVVTSVLTQTANADLGRALEVSGTLDLPAAGKYMSKSGSGAIKVTGTIKGAGALYPPVENLGRVEALELYGGGSGSGEFAGTVLKQGTLALDGAKLTGVTIAGATVNGSATASGAMTSGTIGGAGTFTINGPFTWSGGTMSGTGTTVVTSTLTHTANTTLGRALDVAGTFDMTAAGKYVALGTGGSIHNSGLIRGAATLYPPVDNDGRVEGVELQGGGAGSTGEFAGVTFKTGTFGLDGAKLSDVAIGATVNVAGAVGVSGASKLTGGALSGTGSIEVTGTLDWSGGKMGGAGVTRVAAGSTLALSGSVQLTTGRTLENRGLIDVKGDVLLFDDFDAPGELLVNLGTIRKTAGTVAGATLGLPLRNAGVIDGKVGKLRLEQGDAVADTGTFSGTDAANHVVLGDARVLSGGVALTGTVEIAGDVSVKAGETLIAGGELLQTAGSLSGEVRVTGTLRWDGGEQTGPGTTTVAAGGRVLVTPLDSGGCASASLRGGRRFVNAGLLRLEAGADLYSNDTDRPEIENTGRIELDAGSTDACGSSSGISGDALLDNAGTIEKLGGTRPGHLRVTLGNDGTVLSSAGDLELASSSAVTQSGAFRSTGAGSSLTLGDGVLVLSPSVVFAGRFAVGGDGELRIPAGMTLTVPAGETLRMTGGDIGGAGALAVAGTLDWQDGEQIGGGTTTILAGGTATIGADAYAALRDDRTLVNRGTFAVEGVLYLAQGASVLNTSLMTLAAGANVDGIGLGYGYGESGLLHNTGTLRKTGTGAAVVSAAIDNDGTVEVAGGSLEAQALLNYGGRYFGGQAGLAGGSYVVGDGASLYVPGELEVNGARLVLGAGSSVLFRPLGGQGAAADALASLARNAGGGELVLGRATTLPAFVNEGVVSLGAVVSAPSFRQAGGGVLRAAGGRLAVTGTATLGGRLDTPATPVAGNVPVVTAGAVSGTFASVTGANDAVYGPAGVTMRAHGASAAARAAAGPPASGESPAGATGASPAAAAGASPAAATGASRAADGSAASAGSPAGDPGASSPTPGASPAADSLRVDDRGLAPAGPWTRSGGYAIATRAGASLTARDVSGRRLALVAATCPECGSVRVSWGRTTRTISLRSRRAGRRTVVVMEGARRGTVSVRSASARRVAIDALVITK